MADTSSPLRSVHTTSFPKLLDRLGISLLVSTYQAGKLVAVRAQDGKLNTHFRNFPMPMGLAGDGKRFALGAKLEVREFRNQPAVAPKVQPLNTHDACYLPCRTHATGDIRIHEIAWGRSRRSAEPEAPARADSVPQTADIAGGCCAGQDLGRRILPALAGASGSALRLPAPDELWLVNTRFSCLCTLDGVHSFVPRWQPPFISELVPEDRCHLNGLALRDGLPRYVTCLGATNTAGGWRANKADGGLLLDVSTGAALLEGLSMPHSPRWHRDQLWLLESGHGTLARVDPQQRTWTTVATLPGFTRGLDFFGPYAFIGLSQVRESATFSGIPITERLQERTCGVWVVDWTTGQTVAFLRFEESIQEIFSVLVLPGIRNPEILNEDENELLSNSFVVPQEVIGHAA